MTATNPYPGFIRVFNYSKPVPANATREELEHHMTGLEMLAGLDGPQAKAVRTSLEDCRRRLNPTVADLIEAHRAAEAAVEAAADEDVEARYDELVEARVELLAYRPQSEEEAREKAAYVRGSADCTEDEFGEPDIIALVDRLCEFRPA